MKPLLSICIPTYNRAETLRALLAKTVGVVSDDVEIVVSDNCSTDATADVIEEYKDKVGSYRSNPKNLGASRNFIEVLKIARGRFCFFLSDEDAIDPIGLASLLARLRESPDLAVVFSSIYDVERSTFQYRYNNRLLKSNESMIRDFLFDHAYLTGICMQREFLSLEKVEQFQVAHPDFGYPHFIMIIQACQRGRCLLMREVVSVKGADVGSDVMVLSKAQVPIPYISPEIRANLIRYCMDLCEEYEITKTFGQKALWKVASLVAKALRYDFLAVPKEEKQNFVAEVKRYENLQWRWTLLGFGYWLNDGLRASIPAIAWKLFRAIKARAAGF